MLEMRLGKKEEEKKEREKKTQRDAEADANPPRMCIWEHRPGPIRSARVKTLSTCCLVSDLIP